MALIAGRWHVPEVGIDEVKARFSQILERVARGERFIITRHGVPVAVLAPLFKSRSRKPEEVISDRGSNSTSCWVGYMS